MPARKNAATLSIPPPPPADLAVRCRATIPVAADADFGRSRNPMRRRLLTATLGAAMAVALALVELARPLRTPHAVPSPNSGVAFAETVRAMQRVTFFHRTGTGLNFDTVPQWRYLTTRYRDNEWFDARRGLYERRQGPIGATNDYGSLKLPNNQMYLRSGADIMIHNHSQRAQWDEVKRSKIREISDPSSFGHGIGSIFSPSVTPPLPSAFRVASWRSRRALCFTFVAPPVPYKVNPRLNASQRADEHEFWDAVVPKDTPTLRSEVYVDPETHRVLAVQKYARFPIPSTQPERLVSEYSYDYDHRPDDALFNPKTILEGATEIEDFREVGGKEIPVITHPRPR